MDLPKLEKFIYDLNFEEASITYTHSGFSSFLDRGSKNVHCFNFGSYQNAEPHNKYLDCATDRRKGIKVNYYGHFYSELITSAQDIVSVQNKILIAYLNGKLDVLSKSLSGSFCIVILDSIDASATIITDRFGLKDVLVYESGSRILVASNVSTILENCDELKINNTKLRGFLEHGY